MNKYQKKEEERRKRKIKNLVKRWTLLGIFLMLIIVIIIFINLNKKEENDKTSKVEKKQEEQDVLDSEIAETSASEIDSKITDWELILINKENKLPENYQFELEDVEYAHKVDSRIADSLRKMLSDARNQGLNPLVVSSYRTHSMQQTLYNNKIKEFRKLGYSQKVSEEKASYWVAIPRDKRT